MPLISSKALGFSTELIDWYWAHGASRTKEFALSSSDWLRQIYVSNERLAQAESSAQYPRPAFALWGPSQAGKSTLLSNFLDEKVVWKGGAKDKVDASTSGLSWPESDPCVFYVDLPQDQMSRAEGLISMNPYTGGKDASAVLTRFVQGSLDGAPGTYHVAVPKYPVELRFLGESQVLYALAMGYDTECLGKPDRNIWLQREWSQSEFIAVLDRFNSDHTVPETAPLNREAFEIVQRLCEVMENLVTARIRRFEKLAISTRTEDWMGVIHALLEQKSLVSSPENARLFAGLILWDGAPHITRFYEKTLEMLRRIKERWGERKVFTTWKAAGMLLDMDTYDLVAGNRRALPRFSDIVEQHRVLVDMEGPSPMVQNVEEFGFLQGLVWEIVAPVNFANLSDNAFTRFLGKADLLDFPGVANESTNDVKRINVWDDVSPELLKPLHKDQLFRPYLFFAKIFKRGKTASIVSTYAKRLTIDGFTIFLYLDKYPPVNADQLLSGIGTWWGAMAPNYDQKLGGQSPLPLNLALTWWKGLFDEFKTLQRQGQTYYSTKLEIVKTMGRISNPNVVWATTALNYYKYPRGKPADDLISTQELFHEGLLMDSDVLQQFVSTPLRAKLDAKLKEWGGDNTDNLKSKFEAWAKENLDYIKADARLDSLKVMLEDKETGGSTRLLELFHSQLEQMASGPQLNRGKVLEELKSRESQRLESALTSHNMFPDPVAKDVRGERLKKFAVDLKQATERKDAVKSKDAGRSALLSEEEMRQVNLALRELLNVDYCMLEILPTSNESITEEFVYKQYQNWIRKQAARWTAGSAAVAAGRSTPPYWNLLGLNSPILVEIVLTAMVDSISVEERKEIARWLREDVRAGQRVPGSRQRDQRSLLAVKLSNTLAGRSYPDYSPEKPPSYSMLVEPFLRERLPQLIQVKGKKEAVVVPGTEELRAVCAKYDIATNSDNAGQ